MLKERDEALCAANPARPASWFFNSFFFAKLFGDKSGKYNYSNVRRWSKKFDVFQMDKVVFPIMFQMDKVVFPININKTHWSLLCIYVQMKRIVYHDSLNWSGRKYLEAARQWIVDEAKDKKGIANYDVSDWELIDREPHVPQQMNGADCGVFVILCADFLSENLYLDYTQEDIEFYRRKIAADILRGSLNLWKLSPHPTS